jgi:hypothetical protein
MGVCGRLEESWDDADLKVSDAGCGTGQFVKLSLNGCLTAFSQSSTPAGVDGLDTDEHFQQLIGYLRVTGGLSPCPDVGLGRHLVAVLDLGDLRASPAK